MSFSFKQEAFKGLPTSRSLAVTTTPKSEDDAAYSGAFFLNNAFYAMNRTDANLGYAIITSADGITWTPVATPLAFGYGACICYTGTQFVAFGKNALVCTVMTSTNGVTWTMRTLPATSGSYDAVAANGSTVVAINTTVVNGVYSTDGGATWAGVTLGTAIRGITFAAGLFVIVGNAGLIKTSPDGITWTTRSSPVGQTTNNWQQVVRGSTKFVAVSNAGTIRAMSSTDGITWTAATATISGSWAGLGTSGSLFVATQSSGGAFMTSTDGLAWTSRAVSGTAFWSGAVAFGASKWIAVSQTNSNAAQSRIMSSADGLTWSTFYESRIVPQIPVITGMATNGTKIIAVCSNRKNRILSSSNGGTTWTQILGPTPTNTLTDVCYGGGMFVAVASNGVGNGVIYSSDGTTWTAAAPSTDNSWLSVTYGGGMFVAVASSGVRNRFMSSPDGINWTTRDNLQDNNFNSVAYGNGLFVASCSAGSLRLFTSPDGITWSGVASSNSIAGFARKLCFGNGMFVAVIGGTNVGFANMAFSYDGLKWYSVVASRGQWSGIAYKSGMFVVGSFNASLNGYMYSYDGVHWTFSPTTPNNGIYGTSICYHPPSDKFIATGSAGAVTF